MAGGPPADGEASARLCHASNASSNRGVGRARMVSLAVRVVRFEAAGSCPPRRARPPAFGLSVALVLALVAQGLAHDLPTFPRVRLVGAWDDPGHPTRRVLAVEVRAPAGRTPVIGAQVAVSGLERERGSAVRLGVQSLAPAPEPGVYRGSVEFPGRGV